MLPCSLLRSRSTTFTQPSPILPQLNNLPYSQTQPAYSTASSHHNSPSLTRTAPSQTQAYRRRPSHSHHRRPSAASSTATTTSSPDTVIGHVLLDRKRFRCSKTNCGTTVGRLADLRRHWEAHHGGPNRAEYFCPVGGCQRSKSFGGGSGRSFGTRKDKRDEHVRNVHRGEGFGSGSDEE